MKIKRIISALLVLFLLVFSFSSCDLSALLPELSEGADIDSTITYISILGSDRREIKIGEVIQLSTDLPDEQKAYVTWESKYEDVATVVGGTVIGVSEGTTIIYAYYGKLSARVLVTVLAEDDVLPDDGNEGNTDPDEPIEDGGNEGNTDPDETFDTDPYVGISSSDFYKNYNPAVCYMDAYWRTQHGFMSGSIEEQDQEPTLSIYMPTLGGLYIKNNVGHYGDEGNSYSVIDVFGNVVTTVYRSGAYVTLEEVAAYLTAFGTIPPNYVSGTKTKPTSSIWGEYLRLNHSNFSGNTSSYPYEPVLPDISGCGGSTKYKEIDIGTTGTDCDSSYAVKVYNDGKTITRGAARIVYTYSDTNGNLIIDINEKHVFYTYNHYNDFQEYLNYYGGWGEMFGNITGGGTLSSKQNYNPTPYVNVVLGDVTVYSKSVSYDIYFIVPDRRVYA